MAVFGSKAPLLVKLVQRAMEKGAFKGQVYGPVGALLKMKAGKEKWAKLVEVAIQPLALSTFILDNEADMMVMKRLRKETQCRTHELPLLYMSPGPRYNVRALNVQGIETALSVLDVKKDIIFNFLCDNQRAERKGLAPSKSVSEDKLITMQNGKRVSQMVECYFAPSGDHWQLKNGNLSIRSNTRPLVSNIGKDTDAALKEARDEHKELEDEHRAKRAEIGTLKKVSSTRGSKRQPNETTTPSPSPCSPHLRRPSQRRRSSGTSITRAPSLSPATSRSRRRSCGGSPRSSRRTQRMTRRRTTPSC